MSGSQPTPPIPRLCRDIDWTAWQPRMRATLLFLHCLDRGFLLIEKKRGLGAGKVNAPGGKIDPGETPAECAIRETREEVHLHARNPVEVGILHFQFTDGLSIRCHVFRGSEFSGTPEETPEANPFWCPIDKLPYHRMWQDDAVWLPTLIQGTSFNGFFIFDNETMLDHILQTSHPVLPPLH